MRPLNDPISRALLHPRLRAGTLEERSVGVLASGLAVATLAGSAVLGVSAAVEGRWDVLAVRAGVFAAGLALALITRRSGSVTTLGAFVTLAAWLLVTASVAQSGGATSRGLYQYALVPYVAAALGGARLALTGLALALGSLAVFSVLYVAGARLPSGGAHAFAVDLPSLTMSSLLVFVVSSAIVRTRRAVRVLVEEALGASARANARAEAARARLVRAEAANREVLGRVGLGFRGSLETLSLSAQAVSDALPPALRDHATMVSRGAADLLAKLERFIAYAERGAVAALEHPGATLWPAPPPGPGASSPAFSGLRGAFWRFIDRVLHPALLATRAEARARARGVAAVMLAFVASGLMTALLDLGSDTAEPAIGFGAAFLGAALLLVVRRIPALGVVIAIGTALLVFVGAGLLVVRPEPGNPTVAWILVMGMLPIFFRRVAWAFVVHMATLGAAAWVAPLPPVTPTLTPIGDVVGLCLATWAVMHALLDTHAMALAELETEFAAEEALEHHLDATTQVLNAAAHETALLLTGLSHELRSPLNGVLGLADLLLDEPDAAPVRPELERLRSAGRAVVRAVDTLLCLARTHADGAESLRLVDLGGLVEAAAARLAHENPSSSVACRVGAAARVASGPHAALRAILGQLLGSAFDGGVVGLVLEADARDDHVVVRVSGLAPRSTDPVAERALTLGLALVDSLAVAVGGESDFRSDAEGRWRATVKLPGAVAPAAS